MEWFTKFVRPKLISIVKNTVSTASKKPEWQPCLSCKKLIIRDQFVENLAVCHHCGFHHHMSPQERFDSFFDDKKFEIIEPPQAKDDPLKFKDRSKYIDKLKAARKTHNTKNDAISIAYGCLEGQPLVIAVLDFNFIGGSMGNAVGNGFVCAAMKAVELAVPLLVITSSGGARIQEGPISLLQLPKSVTAVKMLNNSNIPYIVILANPTTGGVSASFAMLGDIHLSEPKATIGFAGKRVIEQTVGEKLPEDFQTSEHVASCGMIDKVVHRHELKLEISKILSIIYNKTNIQKNNQRLSLSPPTSEASSQATKETQPLLSTTA